jgi:large subunit ribosomal protein L22
MEKKIQKQVQAKLNDLRISPRKVRRVVDLIRGKKVIEAINILSFSPWKATKPLKKVLNSAVSNARQQKMEEDKLFIQEIRVDEGRKLKRFRPAARGRTSPLDKKTSRVTIILEEYGS